MTALWERLVASGDIYLGKYAGWYSVRDEAFYAESELVDGKAPTGAPVEWVEEPSYFFRLSAWQDRLLAFYEANPDFVLPATRRNEVVSFVRGGLQDLSVSRTSFRWGIPVPGDPAHVMYVWLDALTNYISAVGYPDTGSPAWTRFWPADAARRRQGHPALPRGLLAGLPDERRPRAARSASSPTAGGPSRARRCRSRSATWSRPFELIERYGLDQTRYFLLREVPFGNDGDFSHAAMVRRINHDLANDFGNLAQRVLSMVQRNCAGGVPEPGPLAGRRRGAARRRRAACCPRLRAEMDGAGPAPGAGADLGGGRRRPTATSTPRRPGPCARPIRPRMGTVLWTLAEMIRHLALLVAALHAGRSAASLLDQLAVPAEARTFAALGTGRRAAPGNTRCRRRPACSRASSRPERPVIVDSHCHLDYPGLAEREAEVVETPRKAGVGLMLTIATRRGSWRTCVALAGRHPERGLRARASIRTRPARRASTILPR